MKIASLSSLAATALTLSLAFGCSKNTEREPAMQPASRTAPDPATKTGTLNAINEISTARCDREVRCGGVGTDKKYESRDQCIAKLNSDGYEDLDAKSCPKGLDRSEVSKCLSEIDAERCGAPLDTLERLVACRTALLCKD
jgi:hypothetical protein